ncbi:MAG: immunoglobulin-like domain-containing protein, partial [Bacillota bacterium]
MKKLKLLILIFIFTLSLVGCQTNNDPKDLVPPNFIGTKDITYFIGSDEPNFLDGISATDSIDGDVTSNITYDDSEIDLTIPGIYTLTYYVSDSSNNQISTSVSIIVIETVVIEDTTPPLIIGVSPITYYLGDTEPDLLDGLVAFDPEDGTLTDEIVVDDSEINWVEIGIYNIT